MLETIFTWLTQALGEGIEALTQWFCSSMELSLDQVVESFPFFAIAYEIFQGIGIGLVLAIGIVALAKFFLGSLEESFDTPWQILFRAVISIGLIYLGGYLVTWLVNLAKLPYDRMNSLDAIMWGYDNQVQETVAYGFDTLATIDVASILGINVGGAAMALLRFLGILIISINLVKLMIEVAERYMVVAFIAYSAPLVFSTYTSSSTADILKKWINMLISQCILMTLSVWSFKIVLSGFAVSADMNFGEYLLHFFMSLAACKIAQRLDDYLQRIGLNTLHTGGSLLDSALGTLGTYFAIKGTSGGGSVLGRAGTNDHDGSGILGMASRYAAARGYGMSHEEAMNKAKRSPIGRAYDQGQERAAADAQKEQERQQRAQDRAESRERQQRRDAQSAADRQQREQDRAESRERQQKQDAQREADRQQREQDRAESRERQQRRDAQRARSDSARGQNNRIDASNTMRSGELDRKAQYLQRGMQKHEDPVTAASTVPHINSNGEADGYTLTTFGKDGSKKDKDIKVDAGGVIRVGGDVSEADRAEILSALAKNTAYSTDDVKIFDSTMADMDIHERMAVFNQLGDNGVGVQTDAWDMGGDSSAEEHPNYREKLADGSFSRQITGVAEFNCGSGRGRYYETVNEAVAGFDGWEWNESSGVYRKYISDQPDQPGRNSQDYT